MSLRKRSPYSLTSLIVLAATASCGDHSPGFDLDEDPDDLSDYDSKTDGDPCAAWTGGDLAGDDLLVLVNKDDAQQLAKRWAPPDAAAIPSQMMMPGRKGEVRFGVLAAVKEMFADAKTEGIKLGIRSAYRSFRTQCVTFNFKVATNGLEHAKRFSAEPGRSQHQLGTTVDITSARLGWSLEQSMGRAVEGMWLAANANRFGFALSYPKDSENLTGYAYEPWHFRYIGRAAAAELADSGLILEQYLDVCDAGGGPFECPREELETPVANAGWIGGSCESDSDCAGIGNGAVCLMDEYTGGHCSKECTSTCPDRAGFNSPTFCVSIEAESGVGLCHSQCNTIIYPGTGCRTGYFCDEASRPSDPNRVADVCLPDAFQ